MLGAVVLEDANGHISERRTSGNSHKDTRLLQCRRHEIFIDNTGSINPTSEKCCRTINISRLTALDCETIIVRLRPARSIVNPVRYLFVIAHELKKHVLKIRQANHPAPA